MLFLPSLQLKESLYTLIHCTHSVTHTVFDKRALSSSLSHLFCHLTHSITVTDYLFLKCSLYSCNFSNFQDVDKTQTEIMRHHTSISELKRSFMESVPAPRPSEWDKRLSTNSPLRTMSINGQLQPAVSLQS